SRAGGEERQALYDLGIWQEELVAVEEMGAFDTVVRNLISHESGAHLRTGAEIDAGAFRLTAVQPLLGRVLTDADERPAAPLVVVLGYDVWRNVFAEDPEVVGREIGVGTVRATVVGVMPEGFAFPVSHGFWLPFRADPRATAPGEGPAVQIFGRLAPGASIARAQAELDGIGERLAAAHPSSREGVRAFVKPFPRAMLGLPAPVSDGLVSTLILAWNIPLVLFLMLVSGNVALLMFARAAARESELVVRSALGAGRRRIVGQLFAEALVLAAVGSTLGLAAARYGLRWAYHVVEAEIWDGPLPFWFQPELSPSTVVYAVALTLIGAAVAGIVPGLKATRSLGPRLRESAAGAGGLRFGGIWTVVIMLQIAITTVTPAIGFAVAMEGKAIEEFDLGIPANEFLTAQVGLQPTEEELTDPEALPQLLEDRVRATLSELEEKLLSDPRVTALTFAELAPRMYAGWHQIEVDGPTEPPQDERGHRMGSVDVEPDFFETLGMEPLAGRDFRSSDIEPTARSVIVNQAFVEYVVGERNALGVEFRYRASETDRDPDQEPSPWYRVIGIVQDLGPMSGYSGAVVYHPVARGGTNPAFAMIRVRGEALAFAPRLREIAFDVDPTLRLGDPLRLDRVVDSEVDFYRFWILNLAMVSGVAVLLSLGGIYSVMSFTVARRTREIGVRVALGAPRRRVILSIFRRPLIQVALGLAVGGVVTGWLMNLAGSTATLRGLAAFGIYMVGVTVVCLLACVVPTRRAL
ncbi:MAG TPA: ABC transporter permease, partial [bacterium]|nr:ABC transporter permease [bacterium]